MTIDEIASMKMLNFVMVDCHNRYRHIKMQFLRTWNAVHLHLAQNQCGACTKPCDPHKSTPERGIGPARKIPRLVWCERVSAGRGVASRTGRSDGWLGWECA